METKLNINAIENKSIPIDKLSVNAIKSIINDDCKIYYQGTIDTSILPTNFGEAVLIADNPEGGVSFEGTQYHSVFKTLVFDRPITVIPGGAFANQVGLRSIIFPSQIGNIGTNIFQGCNGLFYIDISNAPLRIPPSVFNDFNVTPATIIVDETSNPSFVLTGFTGIFKEIKYTQASAVNSVKTNIFTKKITRYFKNNSFVSGPAPLIANSIIKFENVISGGSILFDWSWCGPCTVIFSIGDTIPSISFTGSSGYKWANDNAPIFKANKTYEIYLPGYHEAQCLTWVSYSN